jgi:hypothetical protein
VASLTEEARALRELAEELCAETLELRLRNKRVLRESARQRAAADAAAAARAHARLSRSIASPWSSLQWSPPHDLERLLDVVSPDDQ